MSQSIRSSIVGVGLALVIIAGFGFFAVDVAQSQVPTIPPVDPSDGETVETDRLGGGNRFETSVAISQESFPDGADDVFLARADDFADALSGGTLTTGPILLVPTCDAIPQVVLDEIERVEPDRVVALGGESAVCDQVLEDAAQAAAGGETPDPAESPSPEPTDCEDPLLPIGDPCPSDSPSPSPSPGDPTS